MLAARVPAVLGWFPVPAIAGAAGDPKAALGGGDGFSCAKNAPAECVEFLKYIVSPEVQKGYAETGTGLPVAKGAEAGVNDPALKSILEATSSGELRPALAGHRLRQHRRQRDERRDRRHLRRQRDA